MATKEKKRVHKTKTKDTEYFKYNHEIVGILILAIGVLISLGLYFNNSVGPFGRFIRDLFLGMAGIPSLVIPPFILAFGVVVLLKKDIVYFQQKLLYSFLLMFSLSGVVQTAFYSEKEYINMSFTDTVGYLFHKGVSFSGGGVLGGLISMPFIKFFSVVGALIILTTISLVLCVLLTDISFVAALKWFKNKLLSLLSKVRNSFKPSHDEAEKDENEEDEKIVDMHSFRKLTKRKGKTEEEQENLPEEGEISEQDQRIQLVINDAKIAVSNTAVCEVEEPVEEDTIKEKAISNIEQVPEVRSQNFQYRLPPVDLLQINKDSNISIDQARNSAVEGAKKLEITLQSFGVDAKVVNVSMGPAVTRYELQPSMGVKVSKIVNLADDISLNLASAGVRIEAPIPGKAAVGIEVPNKEMIPVFLREVLESKEFIKHPSKLAFGLGMDISGSPIVADIAKMPHVLIAGATGSGKSVCINSLIISLIFKSLPDEVKLLMIDPKVVELGIYNGIPHLLIPVVTEPKKAAGALNWAVQEMVNRYKLFADKGVRDLVGYNEVMKDEGEGTRLPQIVIIIDELADLMMVAPNDVEDAICRLAQMARAAGMHLVIATQRPSVDVITGIIKANIPSRIAFAVSSQVDSRTILDMAGAEKLLGKGDMLFYPVGEPKPIRIKGAFITDKEVERVVDFVKTQYIASYDEDIIEEINNQKQEEEPSSGDSDELLPQAIELVVDAGQASASLLQRKFKVGYARAARIIDQMEARGIVGPFEGSKPRQVLISRQQLMEMQMSKSS